MSQTFKVSQDVLQFSNMTTKTLESEGLEILIDHARGKDSKLNLD